MILSPKFGALKKNGDAQFYVRLIITDRYGKRIERRIKVQGIVMSPSQLNLKTWRVRSTYPQAESINHFLVDYRNKLSSIASMYERGDITFDMACNLAGSGNAINSVLDYVQNIFGRGKGDSHLQNCISTVITITNKLGLKSLSFADLTEDNLLKVRSEMLGKNLSPESFNKYIRDLKAIWNHAHERNFVFGKSPFRKEIFAKAPPIRHVPTSNPDQIRFAINRISIVRGGNRSYTAAVGRFQAVAMWLLMFSMRGLYRKDMETLSAHNLAFDFKGYVNAVKKGYYDEKVPGNSLLLFHVRHKSKIPMEFFMGIPPILALIRFLRLTIAYTHPTLSFNSKEELGLARIDFREFVKSVPESRVDPLRLFKPADKEKMINYWRLLGDRREEIGLPSFKHARHTFITYSDGLGIAYSDSQQLAGHKVKGTTDNYINKRTERIMARIAKSHLEILQEFRALDLYELLLDRSKEVLGDFGEYLYKNCQIGVHGSFINGDLHNFLSEKESIPSQEEYQKMKDLISRGGVDAVRFAKDDYDSMSHEERAQINYLTRPLSDMEAKTMFEDFQNEY